MTIRWIARVSALALVVACASGEDDKFVRGHRLKVASLSAGARTRIYEEALRSAFELNDPALTLLLDRRLLPREGGFGGTQRLNGAVGQGMRQRGVVQGTCEPDVGSRRTPVCTARGPGYVVRFSDVLRRGGDTVEVYLAVQKFDTPSSGASESLRFERAYQIVGQGDTWRATREARVRETAPERGSAKPADSP